MKASQVIITFVFVCHSFFLEDTFGYGAAKAPLFLYHTTMGFSMLDILMVLLFLYLLGKNGVLNRSKYVGYLFKLLVTTLLVAYSYSLITGKLFGGGMGSGFKEIRIAVMMCVTYYSIRKSITSIEVLKRYFYRFWHISILAVSFYLMMYFTGFGTSPLSQYGRIVIFEGSMLLYWDFFFAYSLTKLLFDKFRVESLYACTVFALGILLSYRRFSIIMLVLIVCFVMMVALLRNNIKSKYKYFFVVMVLLVTGAIYKIKPDLVSRINPLLFFDTSSEEYVKNISSNLDHINDIVVGYSLVRENPIFGLGPGAEFISNNPLLNLAIQTGVHMQYFNIWLKLGMLGFILLVYYYTINLKYALYVIPKVMSSKLQSISVSVISYIMATAIVSIIGINIYGSNKMQFMTVFTLVSMEILYLHTRKMALLIEPAWKPTMLAGR